ncbi:protein of unknown function [Methylocella tundrae]|uniref:Uncharacterized protein n=1 Tax=Methylocella tundrae TaxID=227605 RepID=A0A4U8YZM7_METTU|nr:protein of unknown function [Methylocella tundrae]
MIGVETGLIIQSYLDKPLKSYFVRPDQPLLHEMADRLPLTSKPLEKR